MELLRSFGIEGKVLLWQIINFGLLFAVLWYFLYKPVKKIMAEREGKISESLNKAAELEKKSQALEKDVKARMAQQRKELEDMHAKSLEQQDKIRKELKARAEEEAHKIVEEARSIIAQEKQNMFVALESEVKQLAALLAEKILEKEVDEKVQKKLMEEALATLKKKKQK
ncbi:MAG: ATP synthase F0 subunit B [Candidatus Jacksonbacteria bacterium RIFCSPLOWO2_02_FULL_43_9]|nr:MAG: ATP synthase subunit b [Parcubacteria group bacterium GW2011_GWA2_43_13]OGY68634.1 MAG: ATP synthase F0 subunit B [Candidatus Jacksonbacteria bacterium RIFCSPHIGHO2_02_FULL_43_10]OGY70123.1 MAG: ATP synthase F0 subunit B [Candidatus Jacksonbacteria bacterium RIFCSPLOWO2_01_FULL_44_13]OGY73903.1 MAG: ATP synthase F0 subunit B [Candidatus Jacksonbacteria bacterium RIFCSPLOWO2_02_FULL_43_9]HAZ16438.1 ATP synthase F0 subunit B [Candidatus Jacksonbacteria bacterium]